MKIPFLKFSIVIILIDLCALIFLLPLFKDSLDDWQDLKIESVYKPKIQPLLNELGDAQKEQWSEIMTRYQDEWRIPVLLTDKNDPFIENWHHEYLGQGTPPQLLVASVDQLAIIWLGNEDYIVAGPFIDGLFYSYAHRTFPIFFIILLHLIAVYFLIKYESSRLASINRRLNILNSSDDTGTPILDRGRDRTGGIARNINQMMINFARIKNEHNKSLDAHKDLLHAVAHELRTPLARAQFALNLLEKNEDPEEKALFLRDIESSLDGLDELVGEVLGYSRLQHAEIPLHVKTIQLQDMVDVIFSEIRLIYPKTAFRRTENTLNFCADPRLLKRALVNLISNAAAYGEKEVLVSWETSEPNITIFIDDDGHGIPPGKRERIFEPFTRLDASRDRRTGGTGLGLAIVAGITARHQGTIEVIDGELGGARFALTLPPLTGCSEQAEDCAA